MLNNINKEIQKRHNKKQKTKIDPSYRSLAGMHSNTALLFVGTSSIASQSFKNCAGTHILSTIGVVYKIYKIYMKNLIK